MRTTETGHQAEKAVSEYLKKQGHRLLAINWRRPRCEIDVISQKDTVVYFSEVKYRSSILQGEGLDYITAQKYKQMRYAAEIWASENNWTGDWRLCAASVSGANYSKIVWLELT